MFYSVAYDFFLHLIPLPPALVMYVPKLEWYSTISEEITTSHFPVSICNRNKGSSDNLVAHENISALCLLDYTNAFWGAETTLLKHFVQQCCHLHSHYFIVDVIFHRVRNDLSSIDPVA